MRIARPTPIAWRGSTAALTSPCLATALAAGLAAMVLAMPAQAQDGPRLVGYAQALASPFGPGLSAGQTRSFAFFGNDPGMQQIHTTEASALIGNSSQADARATGEMGVLRGYASASVPRSTPTDGGLASAYASTTFADTVVVSAPGVTPGMAVNYIMQFRVEGHISPPLSVSSPSTYAGASALVRLQDANNSLDFSAFNWDPRQHGYGLFTLGFSTYAGATLLLTGNLAVNAVANSNATPSQPVAAFADFANSAYFTLGTSLPGFNTLGASGHDFASPVPEPQQWAMVLAGLAMLAFSRCVRPAA